MLKGSPGPVPVRRVKSPIVGNISVAHRTRARSQVRAVQWVVDFRPKLNPDSLRDRNILKHRKIRVFESLVPSSDGVTDGRNGQVPQPPPVWPGGTVGIFPELVC
jgi:hypothetical protein